MPYTVYQHINKTNNKVYIGITSRDPEERWGTNGNNYSTSPHFYSAIQKYGWDNFEHNILETGLTKEAACKRERELIAKYNTMDPEHGYNMTTGGDVFTMSEEARRKKSIAMQGNKNGLGKPCSKEKAEKISKAQIGKYVSDATRKKQSEAAKRRHVPCGDTKRLTLRNNHPRMRKVYCQETDTVYKSVQECARELKIDAASVSHSCSGKTKTARGYHVSYSDDTINA